MAGCQSTRRPFPTISLSRSTHSAMGARSWPAKIEMHSREIDRLRRPHPPRASREDRTLSGGERCPARPGTFSINPAWPTSSVLRRSCSISETSAPPGSARRARWLSDGNRPARPLAAIDHVGLDAKIPPARRGGRAPDSRFGFGGRVAREEAPKRPATYRKPDAA
jgi:hypothetical protein